MSLVTGPLLGVFDTEQKRLTGITQNGGITDITYLAGQDTPTPAGALPVTAETNLVTGRIKISQGDYEIIQRLRSALAGGGIPAAMAVPPTIGAKATISTLAKWWAWDSGSITLMGADWTQVGLNARAHPVSVHYQGTADGDVFGYGAIQFMTDAPAIEWQGLYETIRIFVDELDGKGWQLAGQSITGDYNDMYYVPISFGTRKMRCYRIESGYAQFSGIKTAATDTLLPLESQTLNAGIMGDSFVEGSGSTYPQLDGYPRKLAWLLGLPKLRISGSGSTGIVKSVSGRVNYQDRFDIDMLSHELDIGFIQCTGNDGDYSEAEQVEGLQSLISRSRAAGVVPIVIGPWDTAAVRPDAIAANAALKAATLAANTIYLDWYGLITGGGHVGATTGTGNGDFLICAADTTHPSDIGAVVRADFLRCLLAAAVA